MHSARMTGSALAGLAVAAFWLPGGPARAQTRDLGEGLLDHGVAAPVARSRGAAATVDGAGRNVILVYLSDHRSCTSLAMIDAAMGETRQVDVRPRRSDSPFAVILSSDNHFFSHFGYTFFDFDPATGAFVFSGRTEDRVAMSMTEDNAGRIWAATYPKCHVLSYNPATRELLDYGPVNNETWPQYPRGIAAGQDGWVYLGVGSTYSHLLAFDPETRTIVPLVEPEERVKGAGTVMTAADGRVFGRPNPGTSWYELRDGRRGAAHDKPPAKAPIRAGSQEYVHRGFPDGAQLVELDLPEKYALIRDTGSETVRRVRFDYHTEGSHVISLGLGPDGRIHGSTGHPLRIYTYDPETDTLGNHGLLEYNGHWNAVTRMGNKFYGGQYGHGILWEYDPTLPWADKHETRPNPRKLLTSSPAINRPHELLAHPDGRHLILAGTPGYGRTGGGMHIYDVQTGEAELLTHTRLIENQATFCLTAVSDGALLAGGTSVMPGTGGETLATEAELYLFDVAARGVVWHEPVLPGIAAIRDLLTAPDGLVHGMADGPTYFVFDADARELIHQEKLTAYGALAGGQAPRIMTLGPDSMIYVYFQNAVVRIDPASRKHTLAASLPVRIQIGIAVHSGRFYFASGSHLYSLKAPFD